MSKDTVVKAKIAADTGAVLAGLAESLSSSGGRWQEFWGEKDLGTFGEQMASFGESLVTFSGSISDLTEKDLDHIRYAANAITPLVTIATSISNTGGVWQVITGTKDLGSFGGKLADFGNGIKTFLTSIEGIVSDTASTPIQNVSALIDEINPVVDKISNSDGLWQKVVGEKDIGGFGTSLIKLGTGVSDFITKASAISENENAVTSIQGVGTAIEEINTVMGLIGDEYNTETL